MNDDPRPEEDCGCWQVKLPPRRPDFTEACAGDERCRCRMDKRARTTAVGLLLCLVVGLIAGVLSARRADADNLAAIRMLYLNRVSDGGTGR